MQHDTSPHHLTLGGKKVKAQCASLVLAYCRMLFIAYYPRFTRFAAKAFLTAALQFFDGAARRCVIDNTSVILADGSGANARIAPEMEAFGELFGFEFMVHAIHHSDRKGRIERFFRTLRAQLWTRLSAEDTRSLETLNRRLAGWIEGEYHHTPHHGLDGETPLERWAPTAEQLRFPEPTLDLDDLFLFEATRKVNKDRTVSLAGVRYEVEAELVGAKVMLRYDPLARPGGRCRSGTKEGRSSWPGRWISLPIAW